MKAKNVLFSTTYLPRDDKIIFIMVPYHTMFLYFLILSQKCIDSIVV